MHSPFTFRLIAYFVILMLFVFFQKVSIASTELKNPELYKQELLAIEKRLDAKLKELDEKLERLEKLESGTGSASIMSPPALDNGEVTKGKN